MMLGRQLNLPKPKHLLTTFPQATFINAVYTAALNNENVDADSFSDFTADGFFFTVNGMHCAYNYRLRNKIEANVTEEGSVTFNASNGKVVEMRDATSPNVLLSLDLITAAMTPPSPISIAVKQLPLRRQPAAR